MIEVELKYVLLPESWPLLREKLRAMEFHSKVENADVYYDTSAFDLLNQAVFVRVRNTQQLQFKFNEERDIAHVQCVERTFSLPYNQIMAEEANRLFARFLPGWTPAFGLETAINNNRLIELAVIKNTREMYISENIYLSIDHVEGLGDFLEVEIHCEEDVDRSAALAKLHTFASCINLEPISIGYVEMWLRLHNHLAYQLGKYRL